MKAKCYKNMSAAMKFSPVKVKSNAIAVKIAAFGSSYGLCAAALQVLPFNFLTQRDMD
jgi:hypothetical protein